MLLSIYVRVIAVGFAMSALALLSADDRRQLTDTLPPLENGVAPQNFEQMWSGFDPRDEPLEVETFHEWLEDGVTLRIVRFRIGVFKGQKATLAAVYGFPTKLAEQGQLPGLLQIHGGGQYADYKACLTNAKRGYATVSIAWAGRISSPNYRVTPAEVRLFWDGATDHPNYKQTTDWGLVDGYHAPGRNQGNQFPSAKPAPWTLDDVESPRNSGWFLCAIAARRALTFLERQPEVDPARLGVYGHSMGGKLTVMTAVDPRVKAAAPSCGGISDRANSSELFRQTLGDHVSLKEIRCPIFFLSPANDFHGRIGDLPSSIEEIQTLDWRVTCSPHHNHQDTPSYEVATQLWFDQHLMQSFTVPKTPVASLLLHAESGIPSVEVTPDTSEPIERIDVYYTQQGLPFELPEDRDVTMHRFWHHAVATQTGDRWLAHLPVHSTEEPLWVYANVTYPLAKTISGAGYYYGEYQADSFVVSSLLQKAKPTDLQAATVQATLEASDVIEDFDGDWEREWFTYRPQRWARSTHKLNHAMYSAPSNAALSISVQSDMVNDLVVVLDEYTAVVRLSAGGVSETVRLLPSDFHNFSGMPLDNWNDIQRLTLTDAERLRAPRGSDAKSRIVGKNWRGTPPRFECLRWEQQ